MNIRRLMMETINKFNTWGKLALCFALTVAFVIMCAGCAKGENVETVGNVETVENLENEDGYITITDDRAYKEMAWEYTVESDVVFDQAEGQNGMVELKLDVYKTDKEGLNPAIILLHGGGFTSGDKASAGLLTNHAMDYAKMGYVVVVPNYRLGTSANEEALTNAMEDAKAAYEWVLEHGADYGVDTNYVAIGGYSAGAITAINMCYTNYFSDLNYDNMFCVIDICGGALYYSMTSEAAPGCVIVHGTSDTTVSYSYSEKVSRDLTSKGIDVELNPLEGLNHDLLTRYDEVRNIIAEYMYKCLTGEEVTIEIKADVSMEYQKVLDRENNGVTYDVAQLDVNVDGLLDEWEGISEIKLDKLKDVGTSLPAEDDFSGNVMLAWNEDNPTTLYIAAKIKDDDIEDTMPADGLWYQDDCLEIVFDTSENQEVQQLTKWVVGANARDLSVLADDENTTVVTSKNGDEYIYEISIDISKVTEGTYQGDVSLDFARERSIGFNISYNDSENGGRQHQIGWTGGKSSDRTTLGTLFFE